MTDKQKKEKPIMIDDKYWEKKYADMHIRLTNENSELREQLKRKEQECEELREKVNSYNCSTNCYKYQQSENYKQALQEIKDYCNKYPQNSIGFKKQILQKCEVLDE